MRPVVAMIAFSAFLTAPALAKEPEEQQESQEAGKPFTQRDITAVDVATTPVTDLNLRKADIPALLISAQEKPYDMAGLTRCSRIAAAVGELDAVLGDDIDMPRADRKGGPNAGKLAQWAVGSFIPFRGAIREISGANAQERRVQIAIQAGMARRAFLKGAGEARGCRYPARSNIVEAAAPEQPANGKGAIAAKK